MLTTSDPINQINKSINENKKINSETGSIFKIFNEHNYDYQSLFEDHKSRNIGDILTVILQEGTFASRNISSNASRNSRIDFGISSPWSLINKSIFPDQISTDTKNNNIFNSKGETFLKNIFNGFITVVVSEILDNGNLYVVGNKKILINENMEFIKFSGIVNPKTIDCNNRVLSNFIFNSNIEYIGSGYIYNAQKMGWLQDFITQYFPF